MIFRSRLATQESDGEARPAFEVIAGTQHKAVASDWFVTQPDHARISGELAAAFNPVKVPNVSDSVVRAIAMHDIGWMPFDGDVTSPMAPKQVDSGAALSFVNTEPEQFLQAWTGSIQAAQSTGPLGGLLVSAHFARLTHPYLERNPEASEQRAKVEDFLHREAARVDRLLPQTGLALDEVHALVDVLQFCDLASLYLCANPAKAIAFPQQMNGSDLRMSFEQGSFRMRPNLLDHVLVLEIPCVRFVDGKAQRELVPVKVQ